jgi:hypothetical protein
MINREIIGWTLEALGYVRVRKNVYQAAWSSSEVQHFVYLSLYGTPKEYLVVDFGIRNLKAEQFSLDCIRSFGGIIYQTVRHNMQVDCLMRFSLGMFARWAPRSSLALNQLPSGKVIEILKHDFEQCLFPIIQPILAIEHLFSLLLDDVEPCPWMRVNGGIRIAQVACLGRQLQMSTVELQKTVGAVREKWASAFQQEVAPETYIENVVARSDQCAIEVGSYPVTRSKRG